MRDVHSRGRRFGQVMLDQVGVSIQWVERTGNGRARRFGRGGNGGRGGNHNGGAGEEYVDIYSAPATDNVIVGYYCPNGHFVNKHLLKCPICEAIVTDCNRCGSCKGMVEGQRNNCPNCGSDLHEVGVIHPPPNAENLQPQQHQL